MTRSTPGVARRPAARHRSRPARTRAHPPDPGTRSARRRGDGRARRASSRHSTLGSRCARRASAAHAGPPTPNRATCTSSTDRARRPRGARARRRDRARGHNRRARVASRAPGVGSSSASSALIAASWSATDANGMPRSTAACASRGSAAAGTADAIASMSGGNIASSQSVHASAPSCSALGNGAGVLLPCGRRRTPGRRQGCRAAGARCGPRSRRDRRRGRHGSPEVGSLQLPPTAARLRYLALPRTRTTTLTAAAIAATSRPRWIGLHQTRESTDRAQTARGGPPRRRPMPEVRRSTTGSSNRPTAGSTRPRSRSAPRRTHTATRGSLWSGSTGSRTCRRTGRPDGARGPRRANTSIGRTR